MNIRHLGRRLDAIMQTGSGRIVVWTTHDDENLVGCDGQRCRTSDLPDDGILNVIIRRFGAADCK